MTDKQPTTYTCGECERPMSYVHITGVCEDCRNKPMRPISHATIRENRLIKEITNDLDNEFQQTLEADLGQADNRAFLWVVVYVAVVIIYLLW